jgi:peptidyl-prolyl cis-trans isomerase C
MARPTALGPLTAAVLPLFALLGCGGSHNDGALAPVPPAAPSSTAAPAESARAVPLGVDAQRPVATVNGKPIPAEKVYSLYQMNKAMLQQRGRVLNESDDQTLRAQSLEVVLADELLYQAALAKAVTVGAAEIEAGVKQLKTRYGSDAAYKKFLAGSGLTEADVRREVERNVKTEAYRKGLATGKGVSEEQAKKFYDANVPKGMFNVPEQVHVQYILVKVSEKDPESVRIDARKRADEAAKRAASGEDFTALAKQYSQDPTAARGGDIGFFPRGVMFPKFEDVAFSAKQGEVSPVFETPKGFNVMKILEKKPESTRTYEEVKNGLMLDMGRLMEQDVWQAKVRELAAAATIAILDPSFAQPPPAAPAVPAAPPPAKP